MKIVIDVCLPPSWTSVLRRAGFEAIHWFDIGDPAAHDREIFDWAATNHAVVFTHDLDFGDILAFSGLAGPSVILIRAADVTPTHMGAMVLASIERYEEALSLGALVVIDEAKMRLRMLPLKR